MLMVRFSGRAAAKRSTAARPRAPIFGPSYLDLIMRGIFGTSTPRTHQIIVTTQKIPMVTSTELPNKLPLHSSSFFSTSLSHACPLTSTISSPSTKTPCRCAALSFASLATFLEPAVYPHHPAPRHSCEKHEPLLRLSIATCVADGGAHAICGARKYTEILTRLEDDSGQELALWTLIRWRTPCCLSLALHAASRGRVRKAPPDRKNSSIEMVFSAHR